MRRPQEEILTNSEEFLDNMSEGQKDYYTEDDTVNVLADSVSELVSSMGWEYQEIFYKRYGEMKSIRAIAVEMGYSSHWPIQVRLKRIADHIREELNGTTGGSEQGSAFQPGLPLR